MESAVRTVLIGHGYWGKNIARNLHALGALYGVYEAREDERARVAGLYPEAKLYGSFEEVLADASVEAVAISTPAESHARLAIEAAAAGKDIYVEKPLALTYDDGLAMVKAAERHGRILMVGHLLEYHPAVLALTDLIRSGELGKLQYIYSNRLNLGKFRREENILWSFAPHDIAVILRLVGAMPIEVLATGAAYLQPNIADTTVTNLLFDGGVRAHIFVSWLHPYKEQRLVVIGSEKMAVFDDRAEPGQKLLLYDQGADWVDNQPVPRTNPPTPVPTSPSPVQSTGEGPGVRAAEGGVVKPMEPLMAELAHFLDCVRTRQNPVTDGYNGLRVLQVLQAAQYSVQTGGTRVPLFQPTSPVTVI